MVSDANGTTVPFGLVPRNSDLRVGPTREFVSFIFAEQEDLRLERDRLALSLGAVRSSSGIGCCIVRTK